MVRLKLTAILATLCVMASVLLGCGPSKKEWADAQMAGEAYLSHLRHERFEESHIMLAKVHPFGAEGHRTRYVENMRTLADRYPGFFEWGWEFERVRADSFTFRFKVSLDVLSLEAEKILIDPDHPVAGFAREMLLNMVKQDGEWKVAHFRPFILLNPRHGGSSKELSDSFRKVPPPAKD